jgi:hypothetical protein
MHRSLHSKIFGAALSVAVLAGASVGHADNFSTSMTNPTPVPASGIIAGNYPAGQADASSSLRSISRPANLPPKSR